MEQEQVQESVQQPSYWSLYAKKESRKEYMKKYLQRPEQVERRRAYYQSEKGKQISKASRGRPICKMLDSLRGKLRYAVIGMTNKNSEKYIDLIGCTPSQLKIHIESLFQTGMTWENKGKSSDCSGWQIDHKIPCSKFDLFDPEQQRKCFHYSNLQPLWEMQNKRKAAIVVTAPTP